MSEEGSKKESDRMKGDRRRKDKGGIQRKVKEEGDVEEDGE